MSKMTQQIIEELYNLGKSVYNDELSLKNASDNMLKRYKDGQISKASSDFYIKLVSDYIDGKGSTWNQNSDLVLYYVKAITEEMGLEIGKNAYHAAAFFAKAKGRDQLLLDINSLWEELSGNKTAILDFEKWLRNNTNKQYTDNTIYRYLRALRKAEEWFSIKLGKPILEIDDIEELKEIESLIKSAGDYDNINQKHGHGDFSAAISLYKKYLKDIKEKDKSDNDWWPSLSEYDPGISKDKWLDILNDPKTIDSAWGGVLAMFYTHANGATCKQLSNIYGWSPMSISGSCTQLAKYVHKTTNCQLFIENDKDNYWSILFQGKYAPKDDPGVFMWKLRSELYDALEEFDITRFLPKKGPEKPMPKLSTKETIEIIKQYIANRGFTYEDSIIENFYLSLKSKPFVILAGTSGTGKSKLVELFAEAIGAEFLTVAVRPDWSDSSDLFGHLNLNGKYVKGAIFEFIYKAQNNPEKPYLLCLDEMNLARVEYYLSDFLSIIETRKYIDGTITTKPLVSNANYGEDNETKEKYGEIGFPENLFLVGTVNMDETTFPFSKKVLDRANTIEFDYVDLVPKKQPTEVVECLDVSNDFLKTKYLLLAQCDDFEYVKGISEKLEEINKILKKSNAHVGFRVRDEIAFYMLNNKEFGLLKEDVAFDYEIMQKILPRIQGSASSVKDLLIELFKYCCGSNSGIDSESTDLVNNLEDLASNAKYRMSATKICYMIKRYEDDGFTSYWL